VAGRVSEIKVQVGDRVSQQQEIAAIAADDPAQAQTYLLSCRSAQRAPRVACAVAEIPRGEGFYNCARFATLTATKGLGAFTDALVPVA